MSLLRPPAFIADVDGTLADITLTRHHIVNVKDEKDFDAFHAASVDCPAHDWVIDWCRARVQAGQACLVFTGRDEKWLHYTRTWLDRELDFHYEGPFMRPVGCRLPDTWVKAMLFRWASRHWDIRAAIDDRPTVCQLWRDLGLDVTVVPGWDEESAAAYLSTADMFTR